MSRRRVAVTGLGILSPLGNDLSSSWDGIVHGRSGIGPITHFDASAFPTRISGEAPSSGAGRSGSVRWAAKTYSERRNPLGTVNVYLCSGSVDSIDSRGSSCSSSRIRYAARCWMFPMPMMSSEMRAISGSGAAITRSGSTEAPLEDALLRSAAAPAAYARPVPTRARDWFPDVC